MTSILLPKLMADEVRFEPGAQWNQKEFSDLRMLAATLHIPVESSQGIPPEQIHRLTLPSPWARLLLFDQAIRIPTTGRIEHPARRQLLEEWRGLLGLVALNGFFDGRLKALQAQLPPENLLLRMSPEIGKVPWDSLHVLVWDGEPVGGTSPLTVVFTGRRPLPSRAMPFVDPETGRLGDPVPRLVEQALSSEGDSRSKTDAIEMLQALAAWINLVDAKIAKNIPSGASFEWAGDGRTKIGSMLSEWYETTKIALDTHGWSEPPGDLDALAPSLASGTDFAPFMRSWPTAARQPSEHPFRAEFTELELDPHEAILLEANGQPVNGRVGVPGASPITFEGGILRSSYSSAVGSVKIGAIFEDTLVAVVVPAGSSEYAHLMSAEGRSDQAFLFPIKGATLALLGDAGLDAVRAKIVDGQLEVSVRIAVKNQRTLEYRRRYGVGNTKQAELGHLRLWPNFARADWHHYFWLNTVPTESKRVGTDLSLAPLDSTSVILDSAHDRTWGRAEKFPTVWAGVGRSGRGLFAVRGFREDDSPPGIGRVGESKWRVAIDFGSTKSVAAFQVVGGGADQWEQPRSIQFKSRVVTVFGAALDAELDFFPSSAQLTWDGFPTFLWMPRGVPVPSGKHWLPSFGLVYSGGDPTGQWDKLREDLKWRPTGSHKDAGTARVAFQNYLSSLYLLIAAEAGAVRGRVIEVLGSYPSALGEEEGRIFGSGLRSAVESVESEQALKKHQSLNTVHRGHRA